MAEFLEAAQVLYEHLTEKNTWLNGSERKRWFTSEFKTTEELLKAFDTTKADDKAFQVYGEAKDPKADVPPDKEISLRTQLLFMAALSTTLRQQFVAGKDGHSRESLDTHRYELSNNQAVKCHLRHLMVVLPKMEEPPK